MGLDWNPGNKPKPGFEDEFRRIVIALAGDKLPDEFRPSLVKAMWHAFLKPATPGRPDDVLLRRYDEITISAFETIKAPRVGFEAVADDWARRMHAERKIAKPLDNWLQEMHGHYVVSLAPPSDGIAPYSNGIAGYVELFSFRADFLKSCRSIIGEKSLKEAYALKFAPEFVAYGEKLRSHAADFARVHSLTIPGIPPENLDALAAPAGQLHIVDAAGRWCCYWGGQGHFLDPYF
jgi:hypothetical protein